MSYTLATATSEAATPAIYSAAFISATIQSALTRAQSPGCRASAQGKAACGVGAELLRLIKSKYMYQ
eukprot:6013590-Prymnesium_polylepis.3